MPEVPPVIIATLPAKRPASKPAMVIVLSED
jgi:hypothetical protein